MMYDPITPANFRGYLRKKLTDAGLRYLYSTSRHAALQVYEDMWGRRIRVQTYIAYKETKYKQCSFTINYKPEMEVKWLVLYAVPFNQILVKKMSEFTDARVRPDGSMPKQFNYMVRNDVHSSDLLRYNTDAIAN